MKRIVFFVTPLIAAALSAGAGGKTSSPGFRAHVDNPWFPLVPGRTLIYNGIKDGKPSREVLTVTHRTKTVDGAPCVVVDDRVYVEGHLRERTNDWYTQDRAGNVWYFGEATAELNDSGRVTSREGSWQAGVDGAKPGIFMPAHPRVGQSGREEFYKGHAEDYFKVVSLFGNMLLTQEWTPLEPGVLDHKLYVRGIGTVLERTVKGGDEIYELVAVRHS